MKKFVTTLILCLLSALCVFAFTACGEKDGKEKEEETVVKTTVTESEWKAAIAAITDGEHSLVCKNVESDGEEEGTSTLEYDSTNNVVHFSYSYDNESGSVYAWLEGDKAYETDSKGQKHAMSLEEYERAIADNLKYYAGGEMMSYPGIADKYGEFEFDEQANEYSATLEIDESEMQCALKFENGKLVMYQISDGKNTAAYKYTYEVSVTVPDSVKNLPVS